MNDRWSHANVTSTKSSSSRKCRNDESIDDWKSFHFSAYCWSFGVGDEMSMRELWFVSCVYIVCLYVVFLNNRWYFFFVSSRITSCAVNFTVFFLFKFLSLFIYAFWCWRKIVSIFPTIPLFALSPLMDFYHSMTTSFFRGGEEKQGRKTTREKLIFTISNWY